MNTSTSRFHSPEWGMHTSGILGLICVPPLPGWNEVERKGELDV